jgi:hypothetical protein
MPDRIAPSVATLEATGSWRSLGYCPGRSVWTGPADVAPSDLAGPSAPVREYRVDAAPDPVLVTRLTGGGLISYRKPDGRFVHTLNTAEGFARKLAQLGITTER